MVTSFSSTVQSKRRVALSCQTDVSTRNWTPAPTGTRCNDGKFCNGEDFCEFSNVSRTSSCTLHAGNPCDGNTFCNSTCNEEARNCYRRRETCGTSGLEMGCFEKVCIRGRCSSARLPPLNLSSSCVSCGCLHHEEICNVTSGECYNSTKGHHQNSHGHEAPSPHRQRQNLDTLFASWTGLITYGLLCGACAGSCILLTLFVVAKQSRSRIVSEESIRTAYHRIKDLDEEDDVGLGH